MDNDGTNKSLSISLSVIIFGMMVGVAFYIFNGNFRLVFADIFDNARNRISVTLNGSSPNKEGEDTLGCSTHVYPDFVATFNEDTMEATIIDYIGTDTSIVIPADINCYKVVEIADYAFNHESMEDSNTIDIEVLSVTLPDSLIQIGKYAFNSNGLTEISFPDNLVSIGAGAFSNNNIKDVYFSSSSTLTTIGTYAFYNNKIVDLRLPDQITSLGSGTFASNLINTLDLPQLLSKLLGENTLLGAFEDNHIKDLTLPSKLVIIGPNTFKKNHLKTTNIPETIEVIGYGAFMSNHLQSLTLETTLDAECLATQSGHSSGSNGDQDKFVGCIAQGVKTIDVNAFVDNHLNAAIVPASVVNFDKAAFDKNVKITIK